MAFEPKTIVLYSVGLIGASLGMALKASSYTGKIVGLSSKKNCEDALRLGCVDQALPYDALADVLPTADLLILCSPINAIISQLSKLSTMQLPHGLVITDIGSTKNEIVAMAQKLPNHVHFIGGHPMAGSEKSGALAGDPYLFQNALYALVSAHESASTLETDFASFLVKHLGCRTLFVNAQTHDTIAATISHVPHLLAVALVNIAENLDRQNHTTLALAAGGFRDMTRIAAAPYSIWHDILESNKKAILTILDNYIKLLFEIKEDLISGTLAQTFDAAARIRSGIKPGGKGFLSPLHEVILLAKDEVGILAKISTLCAQNGININDIEIMKVREGEGGTIRLGFLNQESAHLAITLFNANGFVARERQP